MDESLERSAQVQALGAMAGLKLSAERAAVVADALEAFRPLLESLAELDLEDVRPGPIFGAEWQSSTS